jgi:hypothetical protein
VGSGTTCMVQGKQGVVSTKGWGGREHTGLQCSYNIHCQSTAKVRENSFRMGAPCPMERLGATSRYCTAGKAEGGPNAIPLQLVQIWAARAQGLAAAVQPCAPKHRYLSPRNKAVCQSSQAKQVHKNLVSTCPAGKWGETRYPQESAKPGTSKACHRHDPAPLSHYERSSPCHITFPTAQLQPGKRQKGSPCFAKAVPAATGGLRIPRKQAKVSPLWVAGSSSWGMASGAMWVPLGLHGTHPSPSREVGGSQGSPQKLGGRGYSAADIRPKPDAQVRRLVPPSPASSISCLSRQ